MSTVQNQYKTASANHNDNEIILPVVGKLENKFQQNGDNAISTQTSSVYSQNVIVKMPESSANFLSKSLNQGINDKGDYNQDDDNDEPNCDNKSNDMTPINDMIVNFHEETVYNEKSTMMAEVDYSQPFEGAIEMNLQSFVDEPKQFLYTNEKDEQITEEYDPEPSVSEEIIETLPENENNVDKDLNRNHGILYISPHNNYEICETDDANNKFFNGANQSAYELFPSLELDCFELCWEDGVEFNIEAMLNTDSMILVGSFVNEQYCIEPMFLVLSRNFAEYFSQHNEVVLIGNTVEEVDETIDIADGYVLVEPYIDAQQIIQLADNTFNEVSELTVVINSDPNDSAATIQNTHMEIRTNTNSIAEGSCDRKASKRKMKSAEITAPQPQLQKLDVNGNTKPPFSSAVEAQANSNHPARLEFDTLAELCFDIIDIQDQVATSTQVENVRKLKTALENNIKSRNGNKQ